MRSVLPARKNGLSVANASPFRQLVRCAKPVGDLMQKITSEDRASIVTRTATCSRWQRRGSLPSAAHPTTHDEGETDMLPRWSAESNGRTLDRIEVLCRGHCAQFALSVALW